ncbi:MAG: glucuronate isomerase [Ruminococcaceae bacterium]|nr:glucuronate isomerase [Oscillospiraceae bacterium]
MKNFFGDDLLLSTPSALALYGTVKDLPIIDYHCHLNENEIKAKHRFSNLGELWLGGDHYKWRAMRLCGVDEKYITGDADYYEKYKKFAEIFPKLCGGPLYYFTQLELKILFGIELPLCSENADEIWERANRVLSELDSNDILKKFRVEYVATTDDPASPLSAHGKYGDTLVCPTFRPDRMLPPDDAALSELEAASGMTVDSLAALKSALTNRLDFFISRSCKIADHGMDFPPLADCGECRAEALFKKRNELSPNERRELFSHLLYFLCELYKKNGMTVQIHFATFRCVNSAMLPVTGKDSGFDIIRGSIDPDELVTFLDTLSSRGALPKTVLYSLDPSVMPAVATMSGAFPNVRIGAAWWFNDTLMGIRRQLEVISEYAVLGTNLGMLTDSRSFASYARFDFFRRILADFVGGYVERGEYDMASAERLMLDICYNNVKEFIGI